MNRIQIFLLILIVFLSCNTEESFIEEKAIEIEKRGDKERAIRSYKNANDLEDKLQWASFLIGQTLLNDEASKLHFLSVYNNANIDAIKLNELFTRDERGVAFKEAFKEEYQYYARGNNLECEVPDEEVKPPTGDASFPGDDHPFIIYLESLLNDDCIEIYVPNGFNSHTSKITSTAHPLDKTIFNNGYTSNGRCNAKRTIVNKTTTGNVLVARPYRKANGNCQYTEYLEIDFTLFLRN